MNQIMQRSDLTWPEKLGAMAFLARKLGCAEADMPVSHRFTPGMYIREMFIPKGTYFIGRAHKVGHRVTLDAGRIRLVTLTASDNTPVYVELEAPFELMTVPYFQTVLVALDDVWGSTYHLNPTNSRDIDALEADIFHSADDVFRIGEGVCARIAVDIQPDTKELA